MMAPRAARLPAAVARIAAVLGVRAPCTADAGLLIVPCRMRRG
ncbi:hypothetical protein [Litorivita sp. NS0012-18]